jgi:hypothetical protein
MGSAHRRFWECLSAADQRHAVVKRNELNGFQRSAPRRILGVERVELGLRQLLRCQQQSDCSVMSNASVASHSAVRHFNERRPNSFGREAPPRPRTSLRVVH